MAHKSPILKWDGEPPANKEEIEAKILEDIRADIHLLHFYDKGWSDLIFHTVFLGATIHDGPIATVYGTKNPQELGVIYDEKNEWVTEEPNR